jgi:hypothetical protein
MKNLKFMTICPDDTYYTWQVNLWLESLKKLGHSDKAIVLIFVPLTREQNTKWNRIIELYPESEFVFYKDTGDVAPLLSTYIPILRPWTAWKYFQDNPKLSADAIFYCDSDILFMPDFNIDKFIDDDKIYLSDTNSYINATYFDSKVSQVLPEKLEEYKNRDVLGELCAIVGFSRDVAVANNFNSGGAQYLLKNIDANFWKKVGTDTIIIRKYLMHINSIYFKSENEGFQSWCADMWAVLWNLWLREQETIVIPELEFSWATDPIEKLQKTTILHNAGIVSETGNGHLSFYKGKYISGKDPLQDPILDEILQNEESKKKCTWYYTKELKELGEKYNLKY